MRVQVFAGRSAAGAWGDICVHTATGCEIGEHVFTRKALKNLIVKEEWCPSAVPLPAPGRTSWCTGHVRRGGRGEPCPRGLPVAAVPPAAPPAAQR